MQNVLLPQTTGVSRFGMRTTSRPDDGVSLASLQRQVRSARRTWKRS